jgi:hypothetical protein
MGADLLGRILFVCHPSLAQIYHEYIIDISPSNYQRSTGDRGVTEFKKRKKSLPLGRQARPHASFEICWYPWSKGLGEPSLAT